MERSRTAIALAVTVIVGMLAGAIAPVALAAAGSNSAAHAGALPAPTAAPVRALLATASTTPTMTFPRTVLVETFTGVWCIHCPAESQAFHYIDEATNKSFLDIAELHSCAYAPPNPCGEAYAPPDGTTDSRGSFYGVCGFPDVFFDGGHDVCGATDSVPQMQTWYNDIIGNLSRQPGNVSISQTAYVDGSNVVLHANVTSGLTGSFNAVSYLLQYVNKQNVSSGYGPHDVDNVVRMTLVNHPVSLTAGGTTEIDAKGALTSTWNTLNFSVVTFVQDNTTRTLNSADGTYWSTIENANWVPVTTMSTAVASNQTTLSSGQDATVTVTVANSSTGAPVAGAAVNLTLPGGVGTLTPSTGVTGADGTFSSVYRAPSVYDTTTVAVNVAVDAANYTAGTGTVLLTVNPLVFPNEPVGLTVGPGKGSVALSWSVPAAGGTGVTYHIFRAPAETGPFTPVGTATATSFTDGGIVPGTSYWYTIDAATSGVFSQNTSAVAATGLTLTTSGLDQAIGWWINVDNTNFSSATNNSMPLYLPAGFFSYQYGPASYAFLAPEATGSLSSNGAALTLALVFTPRYADLQVTITPANATVTLDGSAVALVNGAFDDQLKAGTYALDVTSPGFVENFSTVTLTPGNLTPLSISLVSLNSGTGSGGSQTVSNNGGGLSGSMLTYALVGAVAVAAIIVVAAIALSSRGKRPRAPPRRSA